MLTKITHVTLFVSNQDEALRFYTEKLGFKLNTDEKFGDMRWLTVNLPDQKEFELVLMAATTPEEKAVVGKQGGAKPLFSLGTSDCKKDYEKLKGLGVKFTSEPKEEPWGISASFQDLDGNNIYMCQMP